MNTLTPALIAQQLEISSPGDRTKKRTSGNY